jgi:hypothetical protein
MGQDQSKGREKHDHPMSNQPAIPDDADAIDRDPYIVPVPEGDQPDVPQRFPGEEPAERMLADDGERGATPD